jgi:hypothetical protein
MPVIMAMDKMNLRCVGNISIIYRIDLAAPSESVWIQFDRRGFHRMPYLPPGAVL